LVWQQKMNDYISCRNSDNLSNHHNHDEGTKPCHKQGKKDIWACVEYMQAQIDAYKYGIDIFGYLKDLCHIYRVNESCILGNLCL